METIKSYLENMFHRLPDTPQVQKAKSELLSMMEDKYSELLNEGRTENEAVGTVISEFGNLDELAEDLGIVSYVRPQTDADTDTAPANPPKYFTLNEATGYLKKVRNKGLLIALGCFFCIISPIPVLLSELQVSEQLENYSIVGLLALVAVGVACFIIAAAQSFQYRYLEEENYMPDTASAAFLKEKCNSSHLLHAVLLSIGVILCILSVAPPILAETAPVDDSLQNTVAVCAMFLLVAVGVFLIVSSGIISGRYKRLLNGTLSTASKTNRREHYSNKTVGGIMSVYWPTITCIYLMWSFWTCNWHFTWIIWLAAAILRAAIVSIWADRD